MYLQYRKNKNKYELIQTNNRPDSDNNNILAGKYDNSEVKLTREQRLGMIFSDWQDDDVLVVAPQPLKHPKLSEDGQTLVEMTREEICASGDLSVLLDGEKFEDGHIIQVPNPSTKYLKYSWNRETFTWKLITTKEELQQAKTNLILQHNKKRKEISALNEEAEFFDVRESVTKANDELEEIRAKITEIDKVIEEMNKNESSISNRA